MPGVWQQVVGRCQACHSSGVDGGRRVAEPPGTRSGGRGGPEVLAVRCPSVRTRTGLVLVPESHVVRLTDDGAGTITVVVRCWEGHLHEVVTGRAVTGAA